MSKKNIIIIVSLVGALILVFIFIEPLWTSIKFLKQEIEQEKLEMVRTEKILAKVAEINQEYQGLEGEAEKISLALPEEKDIPYLLVQFENLASANGLLLETIDFVQASGNQGSGGSQSSETQIKKISPVFPSLSLKVKLSGSYDAFKGYLTSLENHIRAMDTHLISFEVKSSKGGESSPTFNPGIFEFDLGISVYYKK